MELFPKQSDNTRTLVFLPAEILILIAREIPNKASKCYLCAVNKFTWSLRKSLDPVGVDLIKDIKDFIGMTGTIGEFIRGLYSVEPSFLRKYIRGMAFLNAQDNRPAIRQAFVSAYNAGDDKTLLCILTYLNRHGLPVPEDFIKLTSQPHQNHDNPP